MPLYMTHNQINFKNDLIKPVLEFLVCLEDETESMAKASITLKKVNASPTKKEINIVSEQLVGYDKFVEKKGGWKVLPDLDKLEKFRTKL